MAALRRQAEELERQLNETTQTEQILMKGSQEKTAQLQQKNEYLELQRENQDKKFCQMISSRDQLIGTLQVQLKDSKDTIKKSVGQT